MATNATHAQYVHSPLYSCCESSAVAEDIKNKNSAQFSFLSSQYLPGGFTTFLPVKGRHYRGVSPVSMPVEFESNGCVDL